MRYKIVTNSSHIQAACGLKNDCTHTLGHKSINYLTYTFEELTPRNHLKLILNQSEPDPLGLLTVILEFRSDFQSLGTRGN